MISVVIAMYNGEKYIEAQLRSVLLQTVSADEVLIFDDGSTDLSVEIINRFIENNNCDGWRLLVNEQNKGYCKNFLDGVKSATGDIIFLADQDDVWYPEKIEKMSQLLLSEDDIKAVVCSCDTIDGDGNVIDAPLNIGVLFSGNDGSVEDFPRERFIGRSFIRGCSVAFKRELCGLIPSMELKGLLSHDWLITFAAALSGRCVLLNNRLMGYRCHDRNTSFGERATGEKALKMRLDGVNFSIDGHSYFYENGDSFAFLDGKLNVGLEKQIEFEKKRVSYLENGGFVNFLKCFFALKSYRCYYGNLKGAVKVFLGDLYYRKNRKKQ